MATTTSKARRGRPQGAKTQDLPIGEHERPRCFQCDSTDLKVLDTTTRQYEGEHNGKPFNLVKWQRCACNNCGARRDVKSWLLVSLPDDTEPDNPPAG